MSPVFADAFYYLALLNRRDENHERAASWTRGPSSRIITTDWVLTEVGDALAASSQRAAFSRFVRALRARAEVEIVDFSRDALDRGLALYESRNDKRWSLTDCVSFVIMRENAISEALTGDRHFDKQAL